MGISHNRIYARLANAPPCYTCLLYCEDQIYLEKNNKHNLMKYVFSSFLKKKNTKYNRPARALNRGFENTTCLVYLELVSTHILDVLYC